MAVRRFVSNMKKRCIVAFIIVVLLAAAIILVSNQNSKSVSSKIMDYYDKSRCTLTQAKNAELQDLKSTDLSNIKIDNITIGDKFRQDDFLNYTNTGRYKYEEIVMDVDNESNIKYLFSFFENYKEKTASITIENKSEFKTISDITVLLGDNYIEQNEYDSEDLLKCIYYDKENNIKAEIVYDRIDKTLCYIRLIDSNLY